MWRLIERAANVVGVATALCLAYALFRIYMEVHR